MKKNIIGSMIFVVGILFIVIGATNGENAVVLQKAIRVCLECIGIG